MDEYYYVMVIPAINGMVEIAKRAGLSNRYCPLLAVGLGVLASLGLNDPGQSWPARIVEGVVVGLSAVGMYSGTRNVLKNNAKPVKNQNY